MKEHLLGYAVETGTAGQCADDIIASFRTSQRCMWAACLNPHSYAVACDDAAFQAALKSADWLFPDGIGIVLGSLLLGGCIRRRVTGSDIFDAVNSRLNDLGGRSVFFLGSTDSTLRLLSARFAVEYPRVRISGTFSPPFRAEYSRAEREHILGTITGARPDVLWVAMTAPKQEKWIWENLHALDARVAVAVGAVFDFYSGRVARAPTIAQQAGLEWLIRATQQPDRLWRRTAVSAPRFITHVLRRKLAQVLIPRGGIRR